MKIAFSSLVFLAICGLSIAQGPVYSQTDQWTYSYEDLSDFLRRFPGVYPLDWGTMGAPVLYRPWGLQPWLLQVNRDGFPMNRRYDGIFDSNLQPPVELADMRYSFFRSGPLGGVDLQTRSLPADSPYTEFQIREGYYGFGTVDFAHAQRLYRSAKFETTGRMVWYNGIRSHTASRLNRARAKAELPLTKTLTSALTYEGSLVDSESPLQLSGLRAEREEANLRISSRDSLPTTSPSSLTLVVRQDREHWSKAFRARELTRGWVYQTVIHRSRQHIELSHTMLVSTINFPGMKRCRELTAEVRGADSLEFSRFGLRLSAGVRRESVWRKQDESRPQILPDAGLHVGLPLIASLSVSAGARYAAAAVPISWREGSYLLSDRPLMVSPEFRNLSRVYATDHANTVTRTDRFLLSQMGAMIAFRGAKADVHALLIHRPGRFGNVFSVEQDTVRLAWMRREDPSAKAGVLASSSVPLVLGLRAESSWFLQSSGMSFESAEELRGFSRLYFERSFFTSPLVIRSHVSYEHIGTRRGYSNYGSRVLSPAHLVGIRISGSIRGVTLIWGADNFFNEHYQLMPGYPMIAKEEYVAFIWRLWL